LKTTLEETQQHTRLSLKSKLIKTIIDAIAEKKGEEIVSLNLKKIPEAVADYFIICEANNTTLLKAIADNIERRVIEDCAEKPFRFEGKQGERWILIDYVDVVIHCLMSDTRGFYNLEDLWQDAEKKEHNSN
jgi:ribosome-associated protein